MTPDIGLANWLSERAARTPERSALHFEGRDWTYGQLQQEVEDCAARLAALGVAKGDRVAFLGHNQPMFLFAMFAAARLGAIFAPLNFRLTGPELAFMLEDCAARALIVDETHRPVIAPEIERLPSLQAVLAAERPKSLDRRRRAAGAAGPRRGGRRRRAHVHLRHHRAAEGRHAHPRQSLVEQRQRACTPLDVLADDVTLVAAPLFHIGGLNVTTLAVFQKGGRIILHRAFDPHRALADIATHRVTSMFGVPAMFLFMAHNPAFAETDLSSIRVFIVGGAPCPLPLLKTYSARGLPMQQGYGLTETSPMVSFLAPEFALTKVGSSGRTPIFVEVKIAATTAGRSRRPARRAKSSCAARTCSRAIGACRKRAPRRSTPRAGCTPATPASSTRKAFSPSATASRT